MNNYCKVLIVEDELIMRQGIKHMIEWEKEGFQITAEAANGQEGLALIREIKPHIVLADIVMPVIDGIEFSEIMGREFPDVQLIMLSSYDKFEYVKTTLLNGASDYILKPTLSSGHLLKVLRKTALRVPGMHLKGTAEMPYASQIEKFLLGFQEKLDNVTFVNLFSHTFYRLLAVDIRGEDALKIREVVEEFYLEEGDYAAVPIFLEEEILCVVLNYRRKDESKILRDGEKLASRLESFYSQNFWVMSRCFSNMQEIRDYYLKDIKAQIRSGFYHPGITFYVVEDFKKKEREERFAFEAYTNHLSRGRYREALKLFREYLAYLLGYQFEADKLRNLTKNLLYYFLMEIERTVGETEDLKEKYFILIDETEEICGYQKLCEDIFNELTRLTEAAIGNEDYRILEIKKYVEEHYHEPLELSVIADHFHFSYSYLSAYFSHTAREGFSEYLNKIRIQHACKLLKQTVIPIAKVGSSVGYGEHSYFCRVFKKLIGEPPSRYRKNRSYKE